MPLYVKLAVLTLQPNWKDARFFGRPVSFMTGLGLFICSDYSLFPPLFSCLAHLFALDSALCRFFPPPASVSLQWISWHSNHSWNDKADALAKRGASLALLPPQNLSSLTLFLFSSWGCQCARLFPSLRSQKLHLRSCSSLALSVAIFTTFATFDKPSYFNWLI